MTDSNARIVEKFIEGEQARTDQPGRLRKLVVMHLVQGNKLGAEIRAVTVPDDVDEEWRRATATKIADQAAAEAVALASGVQRYAVQALYEGDDKPRGRTIITAQGEDDDDTLATEGPDANGLVSAAQRQAQFFAGAFGRSSVGQIRWLTDELERLRADNENLRNERLKHTKVYEEMLSAAHERAIDNRREEVKAKALEQTADKLGLLLPIAINRLAGRNILPENSPERLMLQSFGQRMTPEKLQRLAASGAFDEAELVAFLSILKSTAGPLAEDKPADAGHTNGAAVAS